MKWRLSLRSTKEIRRQVKCYDVTLRRVRVTIVAVEKQEFLHILSDLGIQHAMRMRLVFFCSLPRSTVFFHIIS
jgi:hypothetical protein